MRVLKFAIVPVAVLAVVLGEVISADLPAADPKFERFKREMLPQVGSNITVVGKLDGGKHGWWISSQDWGFYLYPTTTNATDFAKMNSLSKFRGHSVRVVGTLRHREYKASGNPLVSNMPEHFYFDVARIVVSDYEISHDGKAKSK